LHKLTLSRKKTTSRGKKKEPKEEVSFKLETVHTYNHPEYVSNSWLIKIRSNGRYLFAPTSNGKVFVWNLKTTKLAAILHDHADEEVRDLLLHDTKPYLFSCGDGMFFDNYYSLC
jgi:WD40 repeat protein